MPGQIHGAGIECCACGWVSLHTGGYHARGTDYTAYLLTLHDPIALPAGSMPYLTYWSRYKLSVNERALVQVSTDDGASWTTVETYSEVTDLTWKPRRIDLSGYAGQSIRLRFVFAATACASDCVQNTSWWIDDVRVYEFPSDALNEGFETGTELWTLTSRWERLNTQHHTGSWAMRILRGTDYSGFTERLTLNSPLDLNEFAAPLLTYWTKYRLSSYETIEVQVYVVGTGPWTTIQTISNVINTAWTDQQIDLSPYIGQSIRLRFVFKATACSSDCTANTMWWIDDVTVAEQPAPAATLPPLADLAVAGVDSSGMVVDGQTLEVSGTVSAQITNRGEGPVLADFTLTVFEDRNTNGTYEPETDNTLGTTSQSLLAPGETVPVMIPVAGSVLFAGNVVYAFVDISNTIPESDEMNNIFHTSGECSPVQAGTFSPTLEWQWTTSSVLPVYNQVMMAPAVVDLTADGVPDIVFASFQGNNYTTDGHLRAISGDGSGEIFTVTDEECECDVRGGAGVAVGDIDLDSHPEILIAAENGIDLLAFEHDGTFKWRSPAVAGGVKWGAAAIADLDHDGTPEIIIGATVLNANGTLRWSGTYGTGGDNKGPLSLAADLDMSGNVEVVAGNTTYRADGSIYWTNPAVPDGFDAIGNFDGDSFPEVVVVGGDALYLLEHDGTLKWGPVSFPGGGGGAPLVADVDGDGVPEIGVAGTSRYAVFEADGTRKWTTVTEDDSSDRTASSAFDFEGDGSVEIVYGDEHYLRVFRGPNGAVLWSTPSSSATTRELPVIVDVDADGHAEIVKVSNNYLWGSQYGIQVYGDANNQWVPTLELWNQHTYHVTNVNADGSIPIYEANNWEIYNNFRQNIYTCPAALPDLTASYVHRTDGAEGITLTVRIGNGGSALANSGISIAFYDGYPGLNNRLGLTTTSVALAPGEFSTVTIQLSNVTTTSSGTIWVVADDAGNGLNSEGEAQQGTIIELNEKNNAYDSGLYVTPVENLPPTVVAGPDQTIELPDSATLNGTGTTDDGLPINTLIYTWVLISGPSGAVIEDPNDATTTVTFTQGGEYTFNLAVEDGETRADDSVVITVIDPDPDPPEPPRPICQPHPDRIPGFIASPESELLGQTPVVLAAGTNLNHVYVDYWPANYPDTFKTLVEDVIGTGGATLATFDPTLLANDSYVICVTGQNDQEKWLSSVVMVTVTGEYKPGRVRFSVTDLVVPLTGLPIAIGRTYDSLERENSGDFGYGWTLDVASPRVEVDPKNNVTLTMPDGKRSTFYFTPYGFFGIFEARYTPGPGVYGSLKSNCDSVIIPGGQVFCLEGGHLYSQTVTSFTYTDPYGRVFEIDIDEGLKSISDLNGNTLTFSQYGITSSAGLSVPFVRDSAGRITQITDPMGHVYSYGYDSNGDLVSVKLPDTHLPIQYDYEDTLALAHLFKSGTDPRGNTVATTTYYESDGRLKTVTDALGNDTLYAYDLSAHTTTITNPDDGIVKLTYDEAFGGKLIREEVQLTSSPVSAYRIADYRYDLTTYELQEEVVDPGGLNLTTSYAYDKNGNRTRIEDPLNQVVFRADYNQYGGPEWIEYGDGQNRVTIDYDPTTFMPLNATDGLTGGDNYVGGYQWDSHGNPRVRTDANHNDTTFTYDAYGNVRTETDQEQNTTEYTYDLLGRQLTVEDKRDFVTEYEYDALGRVEKIIRPASLGQINYRYDANGNQTEVIDARGISTLYQYDAANNLERVTFADGTWIEQTYDFRGNVLTETDQLGRVTVYDYDKAGRLISTTVAQGSPDEATTRYVYDNADRLIREIDPENNETEYTYDASGCLTHVIRLLDPANPDDDENTTYQCDASGRRTLMIDPNSYQTYYQYDVRGRLTRITYHGGTYYDEYQYDGAGNLRFHWDQARKMTEYRYDNMGQLRFVYDPLRNETEYTYDAAGNLETIIDANDHQTQFQYDALNRQTQKTWPDLSYEVFRYDLNGNLTRHQLADLNANTFVYNPMNRLKRANYFDGTTITYSYTDTGQRETVIDGRGTTTYTHDNLDRVIGVVQPGSLGSIAYAYDGNSQRTSMTTPAGTIQYQYDRANRLEYVINPQGNQTQYTYDEAGRLMQMIYPNSINSQYSYDALNRLTGIDQYRSGVLIQSYDYTLAPAGNRLSVTELDGSKLEWVYDDAYRLTDEKRYDAGQTLIEHDVFAYDPVGNRVSLTTQDGLPGESTTNYTYNVLDQVILAGSASYDYDTRGNLVQITDGTDITTFIWDAQDRLISASLPGGPNISYGYDADGRRVSQTVGSTATSYLWDEFSTYGDVVYETDGTQTISYVLGHDRLISQRVNGTTSYFLHDGQGSTRALTDVTGNVTDTYEYTAFGELYAQTGTTLNSYLYTGQRFDAATEQYYLRAREYDPVVGRLLSRDKATSNFYPQNPSDQCSGYPVVGACGIGTALNGNRTTAFNELNRYVYVANDPINLFDPTGNLEAAFTWGSIGGFQTTTITVSAPVVTAFIVGVLIVIAVVMYLALEEGAYFADDGGTDGRYARSKKVSDILKEKNHRSREKDYLRVPLDGIRLET